MFILKLRILSALIILSIGLTACQENEKVVNQLETEHFIYTLVGEQDDPNATLMKELESEYERVSDLLGVTIEGKLEVVIFANLTDFLEQTGFPSWSKGGYFHDGLLLLGFNKKVAVHELTHVLINRINPNTPRWLNEGISSYIANEFHFPVVEGAVRRGLIPPYSSYSVLDPTEFMKIKGYPFAYSMIDYIVTKYDWDRVHQLIRSPYDFEGIFQMSGEEFWDAWSKDLEERFGTIH